MEESDEVPENTDDELPDVAVDEADVLPVEDEEAEDFASDETAVTEYMAVEPELSEDVLSVAAPADEVLTADDAFTDSYVLTSAAGLVISDDITESTLAVSLPVTVTLSVVYRILSGTRTYTGSDTMKTFHSSFLAEIWLRSSSAAVSPPAVIQVLSDVIAGSFRFFQRTQKSSDTVVCTVILYRRVLHDNLHGIAVNAARIQGNRGILPRVIGRYGVTDIGGELIFRVISVPVFNNCLCDSAGIVHLKRCALTAIRQRTSGHAHRNRGHKGKRGSDCFFQ